MRGRSSRARSIVLPVFSRKGKGTDLLIGVVLVHRSQKTKGINGHAVKRLLVGNPLQTKHVIHPRLSGKLRQFLSGTLLRQMRSSRGMHSNTHGLTLRPPAAYRARNASGRYLFVLHSAASEWFMATSVQPLYARANAFRTTFHFRPRQHSGRAFADLLVADHCHFG